MNYFETICDFAKQKNTEKLKGIINKAVCVDVFNGTSSPVMSLAKSGEHETVKFLIDQWNANKRDAIQGYAMGGFVNELNELLVGMDDPDDCDAIIRGYAASGNIPTVELLIAGSANQKDSANSALWGYAFGGHIDQVNANLKKGSTLDFPIWGYAQSGNISEVNQMLQKGGNKDIAVWAYALVGNIQEVDRLIANNASLNEAISGYANGGHVEIVHTLLKKHHDLAFVAVTGFAVGGYIAEVDKLLQKNDLKDFAVFGFALGGHVSQVDRLLKLGANKAEAIKGYTNGGYLSLAKKLQRT